MPPMDPKPKRPRVAITVGDVSGVGPELALRCAALPAVQQHAIPIIVGPMSTLVRIAESLNLHCPPEVAGIESTDDRPATISIGNLDAGSVTPGRFTAASGAASYEAVTYAIDAALAGTIDAIVTGPIQKEAWRQAGIRYPGHTELLADMTGAEQVRMMLTSEQISCALATIHLPLADVPGVLSVDAVLGTIRLAVAALTRRLERPPRVTVCGLNPHAGEHGMFSHGEEESIILPAVEQASRDGVLVRGPIPPDTAFTKAQREATDVYVCMYHDQGLIPLKALSFEDAVNVTLGLPIVRTSVDHGTALDLAWQGKADHRSMVAAIKMAADLSR